MAQHHDFQCQSSVQTLAEGLSEYHQKNMGLKRGSGLSAQARAFFRCHDAVHVVFGCSTSMADEAVVKLASIFGTTGGVGVLRSYLLHDALDIYRKLPVAGTAGALLQAPYLIPRTIWCRVRQLRRWPWDAFDDYLAIPLGQLRAEFRIRVRHARFGMDRTAN